MTGSAHFRPVISPTGFRTGILSLTFGFLLTACDGQMTFLKPRPKPFSFEECDPENTVCPEVLTPGQDTLRPQPRPGGTATAPSIISGARPEDIDTTTADEVNEATATPPSSSERKIGKTVASLGDVSVQGFWLETTLVNEEAEGRVVWAENGNSVLVTLKPKGGQASNSSQISLAAMRAMGIPLTALPELIVFAN